MSPTRRINTTLAVQDAAALRDTYRNLCTTKLGRIVSPYKEKVEDSITTNTINRRIIPRYDGTMITLLDFAQLVGDEVAIRYLKNCGARDPVTVAQLDSRMIAQMISRHIHAGAWSLVLDWLLDAPAMSSALLQPALMAVDAEGQTFLHRIVKGMQAIMPTDAVVEIVARRPRLDKVLPHVSGGISFDLVRDSRELFGRELYVVSIDGYDEDEVRHANACVASGRFIYGNGCVEVMTNGPMRARVVAAHASLTVALTQAMVRISPQLLDAVDRNGMTPIGLLLQAQLMGDVPDALFDAMEQSLRPQNLIALDAAAIAPPCGRHGANQAADGGAGERAPAVPQTLRLCLTCQAEALLCGESLQWTRRRRDAAAAATSASGVAWMDSAAGLPSGAVEE